MRVCWAEPAQLADCFLEASSMATTFVSPQVGLGPDALCYAAALSALHDDCDRSAALLREMRELGLAPDAVLYADAVRTCNAAGKIDQVYRVCFMLSCPP